MVRATLSGRCAWYPAGLEFGILVSGFGAAGGLGFEGCCETSEVFMERVGSERNGFSHWFSVGNKGICLLCFIWSI